MGCFSYAEADRLATLRSVRCITPQPTNEVILLIFYECSFSKERSVLPGDGRIAETCSN
jgi:hypothetical protein